MANYKISSLKFSKKQTEKKIKEIEDYLGPIVNYDSDKWPKNLQDRWIAEYLYILKTEYYYKISKKKISK